MTTIERLRPIFESVLEMPIPDFGPDTSPVEIEAWDSIANVTLILEIEKIFDVQFDADELGFLETVGLISDALDKLRASRG